MCISTKNDLSSLRNLKSCWKHSANICSGYKAVSEKTAGMTKTFPQRMLYRQKKL